MAATRSQLGLELIGHSDLGGCPDGMQVLRRGDALYVGHHGASGMGTTVLDVADPNAPRVMHQIAAPAATHTHKVQLGREYLVVNEEQFPLGTPTDDGEHRGIVIYSLREDPFRPRAVGRWRCGGRGGHRLVWAGESVMHLSATPTGFKDRIWVSLDMRDPRSPRQIGAWWWPGQAPGEQPDWPRDRRFAAHHALLEGSIGYLGYGHGNLVVLDLKDFARPRKIGGLSWGAGDTHTCMPLPGRGLVAVTDEATKPRCEGGRQRIRLIDVSDPKAPKLAALFPEPEGDFCNEGLRFGPHNFHENRPGTYRSASLLFATYFNAGVRVYDTADPERPLEIAHWLPETPSGQEAPQINDLVVESDGTIYATDRIGGGLYVLRPDRELAELMKARALPR